MLLSKTHESFQAAPAPQFSWIFNTCSFILLFSQSVSHSTNICWEAVPDPLWGSREMDWIGRDLAGLMRRPQKSQLCLEVAMWPEITHLLLALWRAINTSPGPVIKRKSSYRGDDKRPLSALTWKRSPPDEQDRNKIISANEFFRSCVQAWREKPGFLSCIEEMFKVCWGQGKGFASPQCRPWEPSV